LSGKVTATQFQILAGSSDITQSTLKNISQPVQLPPYSVTLIRLVQG
jgi:hypothetical protein